MIKFIKRIIAERREARAVEVALDAALINSKFLEQL